MNFHFMRMFAQFPLVIIPVLVVTDAFHWNFLACMCVRRWQNFACFPCFDPHFMLTCCAYLNESKGQNERVIEWVHEQHV